MSEYRHTELPRDSFRCAVTDGYKKLQPGKAIRNAWRDNPGVGSGEITRRWTLVERIQTFARPGPAGIRVDDYPDPYGYDCSWRNSDRLRPNPTVHWFLLLHSICQCLEGWSGRPGRRTAQSPATVQRPGSMEERSTLRDIRRNAADDLVRVTIFPCAPRGDTWLRRMGSVSCKWRPRFSRTRPRWDDHLYCLLVR